MSEVFSVCEFCFYEHRTNANFESCPHSPQVVRCTWNKDKQWCETTKDYIREIPQNFPYDRASKVCICNPYTRECMREKCTFAHGTAEKNDWQNKLMRRKREKKETASAAKRIKLHCSSGEGTGNTT